MIKADLVVREIAELVTPLGTKALAGRHAANIQIAQDMAIAVQGEQIIWVGPDEAVDSTLEIHSETKIISAKGRTVLPGFVDAHTHLPFVGWRESEFDERLKGATYSDIAARGGGILSTVKRTRKASKTTLVRRVRERLDAMLALGTTTVEAKSGYGLEHEAEMRQLVALAEGAVGHSVKLVPTFLGAHTLPLEFRDDRETYIKQVLEVMLPTVVETKLAEFVDVFVDAHAFSVDEARRILMEAKEAGLGVRLHADQLADDGGAALAAELQAASADHLEWASDQGLEAMAEAGVAGVLLPAATFFLRSEKKPPGRRLIDAGVAPVVATDFNPGTCPCESMSAAIWFACLEGGLYVDEAITAATLNAAVSLGRGAETGSIEQGKQADFVIHDIPNRYHLVYRFGIPRIHTVVARGKVHPVASSASI